MGFDTITSTKFSSPVIVPNYSHPLSYFPAYKLCVWMHAYMYMHTHIYTHTYIPTCAQNAMKTANTPPDEAAMIMLMAVKAGIA